jgi:hypothetical protein
VIRGKSVLSNITDKGLGFLCFALFAAFIFLEVGLVFTKGVFCADDAFHSVIAKNLAQGSGYASSVRVDDPVRPVRLFDPRVGTGPALIVPVSLMIRAFGNQYWVPGLTQVLISSTLLILLFWVIKDIGRPSDRTFAIGAFLSLCVVVTAWHFGQWFALLGEVPAALLILVAIIWRTKFPQHHVRTFIAGNMIGIAVMIKTLSFLYVMPFIVLLLFDSTFGGKKFRERLYSLLIFIVGLSIPLFGYEVWKLLTLGREDYISNIKESVAAILTKGGPLGTEGKPILAKINARSEILQQRFGISLPGIVGLSWIAVYLCYSSYDKWIKRTVTAISIGLLIHTAWWVFFSSGRDRYFLMALLLFLGLISLPLLASIRTRVKWAYFIILGGLLISNLFRVGYLTKMDLFERSETVINQERTLAYIDQTGLPIATQCWATFASLEYMSPKSLHVKGYHTMERQADKEFLFVLNSKFVHHEDKKLSHFLETCGAPVYEAYPYQIYRCRGEK